MPQHIPGKGVMDGNQSYYIICDNEKEVLKQDINKSIRVLIPYKEYLLYIFYKNFHQVAKPLTQNFHLD